MRVLYLGVYRDSTGYGEMAIRSMLALDAAGVEVVARPVKLNSTATAVPDAIREMESRRSGNFDAVVQNLLPHQTDFCGRIPLNIGYYCTETSSIAGTNWPDRLNCLDRAWVCNAQSAQASRDSGVSIPIDTLPIACDPDVYQRQYRSLPLRGKRPDSFIFYTIGEFIKRKNFGALLRAFHSEFDPDEPVELVIKTSLPGVPDPVAARQQIAARIADIQAAMKLFHRPQDYKQPIIVTERYTSEEIMRLHASCDCFVCPSYGEAWCLPAFDAMAMGRMPIVTNGTGFKEYITPAVGWFVPSRPEPVFGMHESAFADMFTARERWDAADIDALRGLMRHATKVRPDARRLMWAAGLQRAGMFSLAAVGRRMVEVIGG